MLNYIWERIRYPDGRLVSLHNMIAEPAGKEFDAARWLSSFRLEAGLPVWTFDVENVRIEKRVLMPHLQNTTHISYRLLSNEPIRLELLPLVAFRLHEAPVNHPVAAPYGLYALGDRFELSPGGDLPPLRMFLYGNGKAFTVMPERFDHAVYGLEQNRGYECCGDLWTPGYFRFELSPDAPGTLVGSTGVVGNDRRARSRRPAERGAAAAHASDRHRATGAVDGPAAELVLAADQFVITPAGRIEEAARARAAGDEVRTVIAGYHWFTDWGRDTMISLEGLTLCTGRQREAGYILRTFGHYVRDGLIPEHVPGRRATRGCITRQTRRSGSSTRFIAISSRRATDGTLRQLMPKLKSIFEHHMTGTQLRHRRRSRATACCGRARRATS